MAERGRPRVLVFSRTTAFRHESIPAGIAAFGELGLEHGFDVIATEEVEVLRDELRRCAALVLLSPSGAVLDEPAAAELRAWLGAGGAVVGVHAATTAERDRPWYGELLGARFLGHPPVQRAVMRVEDGAHPSTAHLGERWTHVDEWYAFEVNPRDRVRVLLSVDESGYDVGEYGMGDHPIAWCHEPFGARVWYTALGHASETYADPTFRAHLLGGLRWALRLTD